MPRRCPGSRRQTCSSSTSCRSACTRRTRPEDRCSPPTATRRNTADRGHRKARSFLPCTCR
jgi:hypothetical protein